MQFESRDLASDGHIAAVFRQALVKLEPAAIGSPGLVIGGLRKSATIPAVAGRLRRSGTITNQAGLAQLLEF